MRSDHSRCEVRAPKGGACLLRCPVQSPAGLVSGKRPRGSA